MLHSDTPTIGSLSTESLARSSLRFKLSDFGYRQQLFCSETTVLNWIGGIRIGELERTLSARQEISPALGTINVNSDVGSDGFGLTMGLDAERRSNVSGMLCYSRASAAFLGGQWKATYVQTDQAGGEFFSHRLHRAVDASRVSVLADDS